MVLSAISGISKRIKEVHRHTSRSLAVSTSSQVRSMRKAVYQPSPLQSYRDKRIIPYAQFAGKILYKALDLERLLEENYSA